MSFGLSISDIALCLGLAHKLWQRARDAPGDFQAISAEVASLELVLKEVQDSIQSHVLGSSKQTELKQLLTGCRDVLVDLEALLNKYHGLGTQTRRTWDRLRWGREPVEKIRLRLISHVNLLSSFCSGLFGRSLARIERLLEQLTLEYSLGSRENSVISAEAVESLEDGDEHVWLQMGRELEDIGITTNMVEEHKDFIVDWIKGALAAGQFEETRSALPTATAYNNVNAATLRDQMSTTISNHVCLDSNNRIVELTRIRDTGASAPNTSISAPLRQLVTGLNEGLPLVQNQDWTSAIGDAPTSLVGIFYKDQHMDLDEGHMRAELPYKIALDNRPYQLWNPGTGGFLAIQSGKAECHIQSSFNTRLVYRKGNIAPCWYFQDQPSGYHRLCAKMSGGEYALCKYTEGREKGGQAIVFSTETGVLPNDDWTVEYLGGQTANFCVVKHSSSATCLDVSDAGLVCTQQFTGRVTQLWCLLPGIVVSQV